jgi:hypothetical protein
MDNLKYNGIHHQFLLNYINYIFYFRAICYSIFHVLLAVYGLLFEIYIELRNLFRLKYQNVNQTSLMKICNSQIYEKPHSSKIVCTLFNQEKFAFCVLHKWYIKRYTTDQIFDCFPVISLVQYDTIRCFIEGIASQFTINHTIWS